MSRKERLIHLLDDKVFRPILKKSSDEYASEADRRKLQDVQQSTRSEIERFRNYPTAERVRDMYHDDLGSKAAKRIQRESRELGLPTLQDVKTEFDRLCDELGVGA